MKNNPLHVFMVLSFLIYHLNLNAQINSGERVRSNETGVVYLCIDDELLKFENPAIFEKIFILPENVRLVPESEIQKLPITSNVQVAYLAKAEDAAIFLVVDGTKKHISSPEVFNQYGFDWNKIIPIRNLVLWKIPTGSPIKLIPAHLIEQPLPCGTH
jgi:hypothetical protein